MNVVVEDSGSVSIFNADSDIQFVASIEQEEETPSSSLVLRNVGAIEDQSDSSSRNNRLAAGAEWAVDLDALYSDLLRAGMDVRIRLSPPPRQVSGRVRQQTLAEYRALRLSVGELLFPLFLAEPDLTPLFRFQLAGVRWLLERDGCILADDMGLGKTIQVISAIRVLLNKASIRTALVVCPKGLIANWEQEFAHWAPELGVAIVTPPAFLREEAWKLVTGRRHVILTNYEQLRYPPHVILDHTPDLVVADEAHRLRNRDAQISSSSYALKPSRFWALTGTPLERDLDDIVTILSLIAPSSFSPEDSRLHVSSLRSRARPFILRRRKRDVLSELPQVHEIEEVLELSREQRMAYNSTLRKYRRSMEHREILALLTQLLSLCDIDKKTHQSSKIDRIVGLLEQIHSQREKAVVFSHKLEPLRELHRRATLRWGKNASCLLIGEMDGQEREFALSEFKSRQEPFILAASSRVGGEGLTLVEANHVLLLNQWWNPSANNQARDRVVRIGQQRLVSVYRFYCRSTIEESLRHVLEAKQDLFDDTVERMAQYKSTSLSDLVRQDGVKALIEQLSASCDDQSDTYDPAER